MTAEIATLLVVSPLFVLMGFIFVSDFKVQKKRNALYKAEQSTPSLTDAKEL
jgi:hypothetical protein